VAVVGWPFVAVGVVIIVGITGVGAGVGVAGLGAGVGVLRVGFVVILIGIIVAWALTRARAVIVIFTSGIVGELRAVGTRPEDVHIPVVEDAVVVHRLAVGKVEDAVCTADGVAASDLVWNKGAAIGTTQRLAVRVLALAVWKVKSAVRTDDDDAPLWHVVLRFVDRGRWLSPPHHEGDDGRLGDFLCHSSSWVDGSGLKRSDEPDIFSFAR
jgi:hypothetical protein